MRTTAGRGRGKLIGSVSVPANWYPCFVTTIIAAVKAGNLSLMRIDSSKSAKSASPDLSVIVAGAAAHPKKHRQ
jgi:hypothetical protein